jgi:transposase-like protein
MCTVPKPYPKEFREDVIRVARSREPGVHLKQIAADFGISESCLNNWLAKADREDGVRLGNSQQPATERELRKRVRLLEQENEVLRRAAAYLSQANLPGK